MSDFETNPIGTAKRIKKLEAMMKWGDEISNIQAARIEELEAKLAKAIKALELANRNLTSLQPKIANGLVQDSWVPVFDAYIDPVIESSRAILAELKGGTRGED